MRPGSLPDLLELLPGARRAGKGWSARCPAHDDRNPSLSVSEGRDGLLLKCHAGCSVESIVTAVGLTVRDLFTNNGSSNGSRGSSWRIVAEFVYPDEQGKPLYLVRRYAPDAPMEYLQFRPDGVGGWIKGIKGVRRVPYQLPDLIAGVKAGKRIWIVEGEKDVATMRARGLVATTNSSGVGGIRQWKLPGYSDVLRGANVVIVADKDKPGREHARKVRAALEGVAAKVVIIECTRGVKDVSDHFEAGGTLAELEQLVDAALAAGASPAQVVTTSDPSHEGDEAERERPIASWPAPPARAAYHGLLGELVDAIAPHTEADPVAILAHLQVMIGNMVGRTAHARVGADYHFLNEYLIVIGSTSSGRKGTALGEARSVVEGVDAGDPAWGAANIKWGGLSSGEGLIHAVRDQVWSKDGKHELTDEGVQDKRLLVVETEFASTLGVMTRSGNNLSSVMRRGWESDTLGTLTKGAPATATGAHISIIGHITARELRELLRQADVSNGFLNRFLLVCVRRARRLPKGGAVPDHELAPLTSALRRMVAFGRSLRELTRDAAAEARWAEVYGPLTEDRPGVLGEVTARGAAHATRLSVLYAVLDGSATICLPHLDAALALWDYYAASAGFVFGATLGNPVAEKLWGLFMASPDGIVKRTEMHHAFNGHLSRDELDRGLDALAGQGRVERLPDEQTKGRPVERWIRADITLNSPTARGDAWEA